MSKNLIQQISWKQYLISKPSGKPNEKERCITGTLRICFNISIFISSICPKLPGEFTIKIKYMIFRRLKFLQALLTVLLLSMSLRSLNNRQFSELIGEVIGNISFLEKMFYMGSMTFNIIFFLTDILPGICPGKKSLWKFIVMKLLCPAVCR